MEKSSKPPAAAPSTEVAAKAKRRTFPAETKLRVLAETDRAPPGGIGELLRREGLYSSHLVEWRRARDRGELGATRKRGPKAQVVDPRERKIIELERELVRLKARAERAEGLVELQKKVAELLGSLRDERSAK
jgi:transposase-like protein